MMRHEITEAFAGIADRYATTGGEFFAQIARELVGLAEIRWGDFILDAGCGKGAVTIPAAIAAGLDGHVTGIDTSVGMLEQAAVQARRFRLTNIALYVADAEDPRSATNPWERGIQHPLIFGPAMFDVILASNVLVFLTDPGKALQNWHRLLKSGGKVALSWGMAQDRNWAPVMAAVDAHVPQGKPGFEAWVRRPPFDDVEAVEELITRCGYTDVQTTARDITTVYASADDWWQACLSAAPYAVSWRHIPDLEAARDDAFRLLPHGPDGMLKRTLKYGFTIGGKHERRGA